MKPRVAVFVLALSFYVCGATTSRAQEQFPLLPDAPEPQPGILVGTVVDINNDTVPEATITLQSPVLKSVRTVASNDNGFFEFKDLAPGAYQVRVSAQGFSSWTSPDVVIKPGQYVILTDLKLRLATALTYGRRSVIPPRRLLPSRSRSRSSSAFSVIIPNFYVSYDPNAAPLTDEAESSDSRPGSPSIRSRSSESGHGRWQPSRRETRPNYPEGCEGDHGRALRRCLCGRPHRHRDRRRYPAIASAPGPALLLPRRGDDRSLAFSTQLSSSRSSAGETTGGCSRTTRPWAATSASAAIANAYYPASNRGRGLFLANFFIFTSQPASNLASEFTCAG